MKRFLLAIPMSVFIFLNACVGNTTNFTNPQWTAIIATLTATMWTPTLSPTPMYVTEISFFSGVLNSGIESAETWTKFDQLEHTIGTTYQIREIKFLPENGVATQLQVDVDCKCIADDKCCTPERAFVMIMMAISFNQSAVISQMPRTVNSLKVRCFENNDSVGAKSVKWNDAIVFLADPIYGYQLESKVTTEP